MYCNHCGAEVKPGARFCPNCGSAIEVVEVVESPAVAPAPAPAPEPPVASAPEPAPVPAQKAPSVAPTASAPLDERQARRFARHRVLGGFLLFLACLGVVEGVYLLVSGATLLVYALNLQPMEAFANEWVRYVVFGAVGGYFLAGLLQLISAILLFRRGRRFLLLYQISAVVDILTLVALLVVYLMGGMGIWFTIASLVVVVLALVLVSLYCARSKRVRTYLLDPAGNGAVAS